ncbi:MAG: DUF6033 family protein, partial [Ruminiclostridium sp.]
KNFRDFGKGKYDIMVGTPGTSDTKISKAAQDYLKKLKDKYPDMDFIISDYSSDEEADSLLAKGKGKYNVLITPDLLERMAADESVAAEYEGKIEQSVQDIETVKEELGEDADMIKSFNITVSSDGEVSIRAKLIEEMLGENEDNTVKADSVDGLLERLKEIRETNAEKLAEIRAKRAGENKEPEKTAEETEKEEVSFEAEA